MKTYHLDLENYVPDGGQVRSDTPDKLATVERSGFSVDFQLVYEIHGGYDNGDKDNASLLVLRVIPRTDDPKRQFIWFKVTLTVYQVGEHGLNSDEADEDEAPRITSFEPASDGAQFANVITTNETREWMFKGSLQAQLQGGTPVIEGSKTVRSEFERRHLLQVTSGTDRTNIALGRKKVNQVWWHVQAATKEDGIGDSFTVALLVRRSCGSIFRVEAQTDGEFGDFAGKARRFIPSGLRSKKPPTVLDVFGPVAGVSATPIPKGIDVDHLHAASTRNAIRGIPEVGLHLPEQGRVVKMEPPEPEIGPQEAAGEITSRCLDNSPGSIAAATVHPAPSVVTQPRPNSRLNLAAGMGPSYSMARVERHRRMAALYERLAQLHREEALEYLQPEEKAYANQVERMGSMYLEE